MRKSFAHDIVKENMIGRTLGDNIDTHEKMLIRTEGKVDGENGVEKDSKEEVCHVFGNLWILHKLFTHNQRGTLSCLLVIL